jgi:phosphoglycerate kinase
MVVTEKFGAGSPNIVVPIDAIPDDKMALDVGTESLQRMANALKQCKTVLWNGPLGAFEHSPFDASTIMLARSVAAMTRAGQMHSVAGGGDTTAALAHAGLMEEFSYVSTAGGAFLEWLEGKAMPGIAALMEANRAA